MTTEEKARAYAYSFDTRIFGCEEILDAEDLVISAYLAGVTEALASQWVSVEERMPEIGELVVAAHIGFVTATYDGEDWYDANDHLIRPTHWLPIPPLKGGEA